MVCLGRPADEGNASGVYDIFEVAASDTRITGSRPVVHASVVIPTDDETFFPPVQLVVDNTGGVVRTLDGSPVIIA